MQIVSYLRVSTAKQGASGLGLEAQRAAVAAFAKGGAHTLLSEFVEVESGTKAGRPQLAAALASCRLHRATLVIAKLDRLARNVAFIANLMDGGVEFVACDMPHANRLTLHLLAAIAEHEREMISQRTKAALQAAKVRGVKLGNPNGAAALLDGCRAAAERSTAVRRAKAAQAAVAVAPLLDDLAGAGLSCRGIARELNLKGVPSPTGGIWYAEQIRRAKRSLSNVA
jgi:DNA invertase Pin-like site-specific DNA recombinase